VRFRQEFLDRNFFDRIRVLIFPSTQNDPYSHYISVMLDKHRFDKQTARILAEIDAIREGACQRRFAG
jgi:hypothetical protein